MPKSLSVTNVIEKNKLASANAFLVLLEVQLMDTSTGLVVDTIFIANNNEDVVYQLNNYVAVPFDLSVKQESGGVPEVTLKMVDFQKVLLTQLNSLSGATGSTVIMRVVNSANLAAEPELEETFEVIRSSANSFAVSLTLGAENALRRYFPTRYQMRDRCAWRYKSTECGYVGALPTCDLSLQGANGCSAHANEINFGGFPGLKGRGIRYG